MIRFPKSYFTEEDGLFSSAWIAAGIDMALHIVEKETEASMAYKVGKEIMIYIQRSGNAASKSIYLSYRILFIMEYNIYKTGPVT